MQIIAWGGCVLNKASRYFILSICVLIIMLFALCYRSMKMHDAYLYIQKQYRLQKYGNGSTKNSVSKQYAEIKRMYESAVSRNNELLIMNRKLEEDNLALQQTIKAAASVGIKPRNYTELQNKVSRGAYTRGKYLGKFLGTAYTPSEDECGNDLGITNSGKPVIPGISIAIDDVYWPFGTVFYIKGLGYAIAMDTGSAIKGKYRFDFAVLDKKFAAQLGADYYDVYLLKLGDGSIENSYP